MSNTDNIKSSTPNAKVQRTVEKVKKGLAKVDRGIVKAAEFAVNTEKAFRVAKAAFKIIKGLYNDPDWYAYQGKKASLAYNALRPFDPVSLTSIRSYIGNATYSPGAGVGHIIHNYVTFNDDIFNSDGFHLAMTETFRQIREQLKSNLPYTVYDVEDFVKSVITLYAGAIAIQRVLGWYPVTRADIPELHAGMTNVTSNPNEKGKLSATPISCVSEEQYGYTINSFLKLRNLLAQIYMPQKITSYIKWWLGSVFIDQEQTNPQMYINMITNLPLYGFDQEGQSVVISYFNIATSSIDELIDQANSILTRQGVVNADLARFSEFRPIILEDLDAYVPTAYEDKEFFNVIINSYTSQRTHYPLDRLLDSDYIRADIMPGLDDNTSVGMALGLAYWADIPTPFRIVSQAILLTNNGLLRTYRNRTGTTTLAQNSEVNVFLDELSGSQEYIFLQHNGMDWDEDVINVNNTGEAFNSSVSATPSNKLSPTDPAHFTAAKWYVNREVEWMVNSANPVMSICKCTDGKYINMTWTAADNSDEVYYDCPTRDSIIGGTKLQYTHSQQFSFGTYLTVRAEQCYTIKWNGDSTHRMIFEITDANSIAALQKAYSIGSEWYGPGTMFFSSAGFEYSAVGGSVDYSLFNDGLTKLFIENVDYHIPVVSRKSTKLHFVATNSDINSLNSITLLKECYVPVIISYDNLDTAVYQMMLGLFSNSLTRKARK